MKKSTGLKSNEIILANFDMTPFKAELLIDITKVIQKMSKEITQAKRGNRKEFANLQDDIKIASDEFWDEIIAKSKEIGIDIIGFAPIDEKFMFEIDYIGKIKQLYNNGIVLGMEMDFDNIEQAPEPKAGFESQRIYAELGQATNELAIFIRSKGFGAIACHPLGGPVLYPAMAVKANMGEIGRNGLLITKEFGPRQRLSLIATNATPLPEKKQVEFKASEFCKTCGACIRLCPSNAILETPISNENGTITHIESEKCFKYFYKTTGCGVCIRSCPFHKKGYNKLIRENPKKY